MGLKGETISVRLSREQREWLRGHCREIGVGEGEYLRRLIDAERLRERENAD